jgi:AcrR family transcriptional regulator
VKKDARYEQILKVAAKVFFDRGFDRASIRDIARDSGMSLAGLYYYFRSKEELLFLIQEQVFSDLLAGAKDRLDGETDPVKRIELFIGHHMGFFVRNITEMKVLSHEYERLEGEHHARIAALRREYYGFAEGHVDAALKARNRKGVNARIASLSLLGMMNWLYTWYRPNRDGTPEDVAAQMARLYLRGLLDTR